MISNAAEYANCAVVSTEEQADPIFNAIWSVIKTWDINVPKAYEGYCGATGSHAKAIMLKVREVLEKPE